MTTACSSPRSVRWRWGRRPTSGSSTTSSRARTRRSGSGPTTSRAGSSRTGSCTVVPDAKIEFTSGDVAPVHEQMVEAAGERNIWIVGGGDLAGQFADAGLLDEVIVSIAPVTLGAGAPLLPRRDRAASRGARPERRLRRGPVLRQRGASAAGGSSIEARSATSAASGISISPRAGLSRSNVTYSSSVIRPAASKIVTTPRESAAR